MTFTNITQPTATTPQSLPANEASTSNELIINEQPLIESNREYPYFRTDGWKWNGEDRWWEVSIEFCNGFNGGFGLAGVEKWRWNGSSHVTSSRYFNDTYEESAERVKQIVRCIEAGDFLKQEAAEARNA